MKEKAYVLEKGSRTEFSAGSKCATGRANLREFRDSRTLTMSVAFIDATKEFELGFGRTPNWDSVRFRGAMTTFECVIEICEDE